MGSSNKSRSRPPTDRALRSSSKENIESPYSANYFLESKSGKQTQRSVEKEGNHTLNARVAKLEKDLLMLSKENKEYHDINEELVNDLNAKNRELADLTSTISALMNKKGKKHRPEGGFQEYFDEQPKEKAKGNRQRNLEITRHSENMSPLVSERKSSRYYNENPFSRAEPENDRPSPYDKNLWSKYEELEKAYRERCRDIVALETRNKELLAIVKDWEARFKQKAEQEEAQVSQRLAEREKEFQKKAVELREKCHQDLRVQEEKFKETMDTLEAEFKKILIENRDKITELKSRYQEKCEAAFHSEDALRCQTKEIEELQKKLREKDSQNRALQLTVEKLEKENNKLADEVFSFLFSALTLFILSSPNTDHPVPLQHKEGLITQVLCLKPQEETHGLKAIRVNPRILVMRSKTKPYLTKERDWTLKLRTIMKKEED